MTFEDFNLTGSILESVKKEGFTRPTAIQQQSIPKILEGKDIFGCAQTGTGKTAAFSLPIIHLLLREKNHAGHQTGIKSLVIAPTRELVIQIHESFQSFGTKSGIRSACIYGGVSQQAQVNELKRGVSVVIATPGRLLDLVNQRLIRLDTIRHFVLDEADRMLDMGFINDIHKIVALLPRHRQTLFFAATSTPEIRKLAQTLLVNPATVTVTPDSSVSGLITQQLYFVKKEDKRHLLNHVINHHAIGQALIFTRTKHGADRVARDLNRKGIRAEAIHGDKSQNKRERNLEEFRNGKLRALVATDVASRGIDIEKLGHVINYEIPETPSTYVHRIGRTGRAGSKGIAMSFCTSEERGYVTGIEKLIKNKIDVVKGHPFS